jgi:amidophosphoribosyltransferase
MEDIISHNCGVVVAQDLHDGLQFLKSIRHRGDEGSGIAGVRRDGKTDILKWLGPVDAWSIDTLHEFFPETDYHTFLLHTRYATKGSKGDFEQMLREAQPIGIGGNIHTLGMNGQRRFLYITNCTSAIAHNGQVDSKYYRDVQNELVTGSDSEGLLRMLTKFGPQHVMAKIHGSYTAAYIDDKLRNVTILRDRFGMMPAFVGSKDGKFIFSSEDCSFIEADSRDFNPLNSGSVVYLDKKGNVVSEQLSNQTQRSHCVFQNVYVASVKSNLFGASNRVLRRNLGEQLAIEFPLEADFITYVPSCPFEAATSVASYRRMPLQRAFAKMNKARSFLNPTQEARQDSINRNLFVHPDVLRNPAHYRGKVGIAIEDSVVRGTVLSRASQLKEEIGLAKLYVLSMMPAMCPVIKGKSHHCEWGIDMPDKPDYFSRKYDTSKLVSFDGLEVGFMSRTGFESVLLKSGLKPELMCMYCIGGKHPFKK